MKVSSKFIIVEHQARRAGLHYDLRFRMPKSRLWASFAVRKGIPEEVGKKVLAVRTHDHTEKEALFTGEIKSGYGAGKLKKWDSGPCIITKYTSAHIIVEFKGRKIKGIYHLINTGVMNKDYKSSQYLLFKGKNINEISGLASRVPPGDTQEVEIDDEIADKQQQGILRWSLTEIYLKELFFKPKRPLERIRHLKIIDKFNMDKDNVLIMGSAVLVLHGVIEKNDDLDLIVSRNEFNKLKKDPRIKKDYKYNKVFLRTKDGKMEAAVNFQVLGKTFEQLFKRSLEVNGYHFMSLRDTYKMYKKLDREKDKEKIIRLKRIFH